MIVLFIMRFFLSFVKMDIDVSVIAMRNSPSIAIYVCYFAGSECAELKAKT